MSSRARKGTEGERDVRRLGGGLDPLGMVWRGIVPDEQQLGHRGAPLAEGLHEGGAVILPAALAHERDELAGGRIEGAVYDPAGVPP